MTSGGLLTFWCIFFFFIHSFENNFSLQSLVLTRLLCLVLLIYTVMHYYRRFYCRDFSFLIMVPWSRSAVLSLYKNLLKRGYKELNYTDKDYYLHCIRSEFQKYKSLTNPEHRQHQLDKGYFFLENKRGKIL